MSETPEINEIEAVVAEIKGAAVDAAKAELADVVKAEQLTEIQEKAAAEAAELKSHIEALEAKLDAIPTPSILKEEVKMNTLNAEFAKNLEATGKAFADIETKGINEARDVTGGDVETFGLSGSLFAHNPVRKLAANLMTSGTSFVMPVRTGNHGAANIGATGQAADGGSAAVQAQTFLLQTYAARADVNVQVAEDIVGFDAFWAEDMLREVASVEAAAHVTAIEAAANSTTAGSATELELDDLANMVYDLSPAYRPNATVMLSTAAMARARALTSAATGGELVFDSEIGMFRLFGLPVMENAYMASTIATGEVVGAVADWSKFFIIGEKDKARVGRYEQTVPGAYAYYAELRSGGGIWVPEAGNILAMA